MKITKHLLEQFISLQDVDTDRLLVELNKIGLEVESFYEIEINPKVVVGKVIQKEKHPDADKLSVCQVDVGDKVLQIVCGASNVKAGQWVAVALEGANLQTPKGELRIAQTTLRGVQSVGMLCSSVELGLPKINEGIMELDSSLGELEVGRPLASYALFDNFVIELGLTPNRGDCLSVLGVARDLSVALGIGLKHQKHCDENTVLGIGRVLQVVNEGNFSSSVLYKVACVEALYTPLEISLSLSLCDIALDLGLKNFLNYAIHNVGVILQAYDFDDFVDHTSHLEEAKAELLLRHQDGIDYVYTKTNKQQSIVGISSNSIQEKKGMVILEASYVNPRAISELIYNHPEIKKDALITYKTTRGSNPDLLLGMQFLCNLFIRYTQIEIYSSHHTIALEDQNICIKATYESIISILGQDISKEDMTNLLKKNGFKIEASFDESFFMAIPPRYRQDILSIQDLSEEILRFYGIDKIQSTPLCFIEQSPRSNPLYFRFKAKRGLMKKASAQGFCETLHYVFTERKKMQELGVLCVDEKLEILNPITSELDTFRTSLIPSMLESIQRNKNLGFKAIALCEIGICYTQNRDEVEKIAFVVDELEQNQSLSYPKGKKWDFYQFASRIVKVIGEFELEALDDFSVLSPQILHPFQSAWIVRGGTRIGYIGKINPQIQEGFICEVLLDSLLVEPKQLKQEISKFQANTRDLTLMIKKEIRFSQIKKVIEDAGIAYLTSFYPLDLYEDSSFGDKVALSLRFVLQSREKTLQDEDLELSIQKILQILDAEFGASLRQ